jgi:hypothetical protein
MRLFDYFTALCLLGLAIIFAVSYNSTINRQEDIMDLISSNVALISGNMTDIEDGEARDNALMQAAYMLAEQQDMIIETVNDMITEME